MKRSLLPLVVAVGLLAVTSPAHAQALRFLGIDGMTQTVKQEGQSTISGLALRFRLDSDDLPAGLTVMPTIEHWRDSDHLEDFNIRSAQRDLALGMDGRFDWQWGKWRPYAGTGLAIHFVKTEFAAPDLGQEHTETSRTKVGPNALLGLQLPPAAWLQSYVEAKYMHVPPFRQFKLNWGFGVNF